MKKYDIFLFDADDTLYDFSLSSAYALKSMFEQCNFDYSDSIQAEYIKINIQEWQRYEKGEISVQELQITRFSRLFEEIGVFHDVEDFNKRYLYELGKGMFLTEDALEICGEIVAQGKQIYIITNGLVGTQEARAKHSPLSKYITGVFVSQAVGHQKPDKEYFRHVLANIPADKDKMLVIGDSLAADIAGGNSAGVDTCWLNTHGTKNLSKIKPVYEIINLRQLQKFI